VVEEEEVLKCPTVMEEVEEPVEVEDIWLVQYL
jgi:hypothetical protein